MLNSSIFELHIIGRNGRNDRCYYFHDKSPDSWYYLMYEYYYRKSSKEIMNENTSSNEGNNMTGQTSKAMISGTDKSPDHTSAKKTSAELHVLFEFRDINRDSISESDEAALVEKICFPPNEACAPDKIAERIQAAPDLFLVVIDKETGKMAGFLNGIATDEEKFRDEFFTDAGLNRPDGKNVMLLGLDVLPEFRRIGLATEIVRIYCEREKQKNRKRLILTCHDSKVEMYEKMGLKDLGMADSTWGGEVWHEMDIEL